jgi:hypothetical protein
MPNAALKQPKFDPKEDILARLGDLSHLEIAQNEVLLAIYVRPEKTAGGIFLTANIRKEDVYQGKVGLVVKIGAACSFTQEDPYAGQKIDLPIELYDWVVVRPSDTWALDINGNATALKYEDFVPCRLVRDRHIRLRIENPEVIW